MAVAGGPWQLKCENVEQRCAYLLTSGQWSDCTLMVGSGTEGEVIPAHKLVLAMASPVFEAMFYGALSERNDPIVSIPDVEPEAFRALLQYVYTGNIDISSFDLACDLWYGAKKYMLPHLEKQCSSYICSAVGPRNVFRAYELAHLFEEETVVDKCIQIICTNTKEVLNDSSFVDVELKTLITVCSLEHLTVDSELDLFHAVARYAEEQRRQGQISPPVEGGPSEELSQKELLPSVVSSSTTSPAAELDSQPPPEVGTSEPTADKQNVEEEEPSTRAAVQKLRFLSLTAAQFAEGPARSALLTKDESFALFMNIGSRDSPVPMPSRFPLSVCGFGAAAAPGGTAHVKYAPLVGTDVVVKSGASRNINIKYHCITFMKEYESQSLEELRLEDYTAGRKGSSSGRFGINQPTENKPLFGAQASTFGAPATSATPSVFGGGGALGTLGGCGQTNSSFSLGGAGTQTNTNTTGLFNAQPFGQTSTAGTSLFGATPATQASTFGTPTSTFGFGSNLQNQTTGGGLFGAKPASTGFGAPAASASFGAFGAADEGLFGAKPLQAQAPAFGAPQAGVGSMAGGFGTSTSTSGGLFGGAGFGKPATTQPSFGFEAPQPTLGTSQFGATPATQASTFGTPTSTFSFGSNLQNQTTGGGLFGAKPASTGFGAPAASASFGAFGAADEGLFGAKPLQAQAPAFGAPQAGVGSMAGGFGTSTSTSGGLFGGAGFGKPATTQPSFGFEAPQPTLGTSQFGATPATQASTFGTPTSTFSFGSNLQNQTTGGGLFGAKPASTGFGAPAASASFGAFGAADEGLFGAKPLQAQAPAFGAPQAGVGSMAGGFGTSTSTSGGLFGGAGFGKPATTQPSFGFEAPQPTLEEPSIRAALQKLRFLSLTAAQFAEGPARSALLTKDESFAVLMNISSRDSPVPMPPGFSECRERRQPQNAQCFEAGSLDHTINALKCGDPSQVEDAAEAAADMLWNSDIQPALDKGILDALVPALTEGSDKGKEHAAEAFRWLCRRASPAQLRVLAEGAALQPYCRLLAATWGYTCFWVLLGLTHLLQKVDQNTKPDLLRKLRALGVPQLLIPLKQHSDEDISELADDLLRTYFNNDQ